MYFFLNDLIQTSPFIDEKGRNLKQGFPRAALLTFQISLLRVGGWGRLMHRAELSGLLGFRPLEAISIPQVQGLQTPPMLLG